MIVHVHDCDGLSFLLLLRQLNEQFRLRFEVIFHRAVIIEMVLRQISEDSDVPLEAAYALLRQRVGRNLHGRGTTTGVRDLREQLLQVERFRRRPRGWQNALTDFIAHRPDQTATQAGLFTDVFDEKGGGGFSIGAGDGREF